MFFIQLEGSCYFMDDRYCFPFLTSINAVGDRSISDLSYYGIQANVIPIILRASQNWTKCSINEYLLT